MHKVYADSALQISQGDFESPAEGISTELDCNAYKKVKSGGVHVFDDF